MQWIETTREEAEHRAAELIADTLPPAVDRRGRAVLAVPGGRSVGGVLRALTASDAPFEALHVFFVDERCVPLDSAESNYGVVRASLLDSLIARNAAVPAVHPFHCRESEPDLGAAAYESAFRQTAQHPDVALFGVGEDGHIASLFPESPLLTERRRCFAAVYDAPKPPRRRITATPALFGPEMRVILLFFGENKRDALSAFLADHGSPAACPARVVKPASDLWVVTDLHP